MALIAIRQWIALNLAPAIPSSKPRLRMSVANKPGLGVLLDLDQTLVLTDAIEPLRRKRDWRTVYQSFDKTSLPPGTKAFIQQIRRLARVGVVTTSPRPYAERLLAYHDLEVPVLVAYRDVTTHKPHPEPLLLAARLLEIRVQNCVHVGDSATDIEASVRAGAIAAVVAWGAPNAIIDVRVKLVAHAWDDVLQFVRSKAGVPVVSERL